MQDAFSIIIPTFREAQNIPDLVSAIANVDFENREFEVIVVDDDSKDGLAYVIDALQSEYPWLKLISRQQTKNLSAAILEGIAQSKYPICVTMDADLSHPPNKIPEMLNALDQHDLSIGSRYIKSGSSEEAWPLHRKIISLVVATLVRYVINIPIKDPLSGFIAINKSSLKNIGLIKPIGWKLGLEIIVKCNCKKIAEIPIHFSARKFGYSKFNIKIVLQFLYHLSLLLKYKFFNHKFR